MCVCFCVGMEWSMEMGVVVEMVKQKRKYKKGWTV